MDLKYWLCTKLLQDDSFRRSACQVDHISLEVSAVVQVAVQCVGGFKSVQRLGRAGKANANDLQIS